MSEYEVPLHDPHDSGARSSSSSHSSRSSTRDNSDRYERDERGSERDDSDRYRSRHKEDEVHESRSTRDHDRHRDDHRSADRDRDRERDKERDRDADRERDRDRDRDRDSDRDRERDREREYRHSERDRYAESDRYSDRYEEEDDYPMVYVAGLSMNATEGDVRNLFSEYGRVVDISIVTNPRSGVSRGFGFITYHSLSQAEAAIRALHGSNFYNKRLLVELSKRKAPRQPTPGQYLGTDKASRRIPGGGPERHAMAGEARMPRGYPASMYNHPAYLNSAYAGYAGMSGLAAYPYAYSPYAYAVAAQQQQRAGMPGGMAQHPGGGPEYGVTGLYRHSPYGSSMRGRSRSRSRSVSRDVSDRHDVDRHRSHSRSRSASPVPTTHGSRGGSPL